MSRIISIDYGLKRTGLAVTDPLQIIATGLTTVHSKELIPFLKDYFEKEPVELIIIGVVFTMADGSQQTVPVDAAAANLLGVLKMDAKNFAGAKTDFQQALKLYPDFAGAKLNLDVCDKNLKGGTKTPTKAPTKPKG